MRTSKNAHAAHTGLCANIAKASRKAVTTALICVLLAGMLTACGGGIGALAVMVLFKHKTKDKVFRITVPIATAVHMAVLIYLILWELGVVS